MLYVPFVAGALVAWTFSWRVVVLVLAVTFLFIARESLLAWWRARRRKQNNTQAGRVALLYLTTAAAFALPLILVGQLWGLVPLGIAAALVLAANAEQAVRREDRTVSGEALAVLGLTMTAPAAHYTAWGAWHAEALWLWLLCALYFASSIFYVKLRVHAANPRKEEARRMAWRHCASYHAFLFIGLTVLAVTGSLNLFALIAFAPVLGRSFWYLFKPSTQLNLKRIGVLEIVYSVVFLVFLTLTFR
jgi:hypothetical protein